MQSRKGPNNNLRLLFQKKVSGNKEVRCVCWGGVRESRLTQQRKKKWTSLPLNEGSPDGHGRLSLRGKGEGYMGNVVNGSISHRETRGCLSPAVDSSQPTCIDQSNYK